MRRVTFSRNYTLSLSRTCRCYCKYCAFATHRAHLYSPAEVEGILDDASRRGAKELLVLTGERPEVNSEVAARLAEYGHADFTSYVAWACERAMERGMLPHTNLGALSREDLGRLREVTASQGLMLESINPDLVVHQGSPTKHPSVRLDTIRAAGELPASRSRAESWWGSARRPSGGSRALEALAELHARARAPAGGHPAELRCASALLRRRAGARSPTGYSAASQREGGRRARRPPSVGHADRARRHALAGTRVPAALCQTWVQIPPNLSDWWLALVEEGAADLGGLSANGDHISPEHPFPSVHRMRKRLAPLGYALTERLCVYPQYMDPQWLEQGVLDLVKLKYWSFIPRSGSGRREERPIRASSCRARSRGRATAARSSPDELTAHVRRDTAGGDRGHAPGGGRAA